MTKSYRIINRYMNPYYFHLALDLPLFRSGIDLSNHETSEYHTKFNTRAVISSELIDLASSLGLLFDTEIELFSTEPFKLTIIHTDVGHGDYPKLNYVFGGVTSYMNWYEPKFNKNSTEIALDNRHYIPYEEHEVTPILSERIGLGHFSVVQTGIPHNVTNFKQKRRCFSLVFLNKKTLMRPTMEETYKLFSNYLL